MNQPRPWLPPEAFSLGNVGRALAGALAAWGEYWLGDNTIMVAEVWQVRAANAADQTLHVTAGVLSARAPGRAKRALLERALGASLEGEGLSERDHQLLDAFGAKMLDDLLQRITSAADVLDGGGDRVSVVVADGGDELCFIDMAGEALVPLIRSTMFQGEDRAPTLIPRLKAVRPSRVTVEAQLGTAILTMGDLSDVAIGDVIRLERKADAPVEMVISGPGRCVLGRAQMLRRGEQMCVQF
jgi:flagellar motor switch/type III secretory pathway protein FliN